MGPLITIWSIRLALTMFFGTLIGWVLVGWGLVGTQRFIADKWRRLLTATWTIGCLAAICHLIAAFQFHHHWSHSAALADTARKTKELMGFEFGNGIYFSYLFVLLWAVDAIWRLTKSTSNSALISASNSPPALTRWPEGLCLTYLLFIVFNGTVVFESGWTRLSGALGTLILIGLILVRWSTSRTGIANRQASQS